MPRKISFLVPPAEDGVRLDLFLHGNLPELSRTFIKKVIEGGNVTLDGTPPKKAGVTVNRGCRVNITIPDPEPYDLEPEDIDIDILYEDDSLAVIEKPAGIVVHPSAGHREGTLVNALLARLDKLSSESGNFRPGIVHRLDKDTSGVMIVAKSDRAHRSLAVQFSGHTISRKYRGIVRGEFKSREGRIETLIGRHPRNRKKMSVIARGGKRALTLYRVIKEKVGFSMVEFTLHTGRTHQIRVHCSHMGHPVVGDPVYSSKGRTVRVKREGEIRTFSLDRNLLHAYQVGFKHPVTGELMSFETGDPVEFFDFWNFLE